MSRGAGELHSSKAAESARENLTGLCLFHDVGSISRLRSYSEPIRKPRKFGLGSGAVAIHR